MNFRPSILLVTLIAWGLTTTSLGFGQSTSTTRIRLADSMESNSPANHAPVVNRDLANPWPNPMELNRVTEKESEEKGPAKCKYCEQIATCKVCRAVPEKKKVSETVFSCECEDFCIPGRSQVQCQESIDENGCVQTEREWIPTAARMSQRKKLVKTTETNEVTQWKLVVEHVCPNCAQCPAQPIEPAQTEQSEKSQPATDKVPQAGSATTRLPLWFRR